MNEQVTRQILWNIPVPFIVLMYVKSTSTTGPPMQPIA